ncbi:polyadenylate-binding protein-interacting protein 1-like [Panthera pardus]|uniref:Polyadenylate-binding protein-interacting protein 1-like n=1 Tax=Panthera pardus TaxID=9691 RepID=A0A9V1F608_PANPR|nr:polyadenylate-binding protein-interacting protein 1-like [Panthera pardus]
MPEPILEFNCNYVTADPDYQEKYQELLERVTPDYEENGIGQSAAGDPYLDDGNDEMDPETEEAYNNLVWTQSISESDKAKFQHISFIKQFGLW